MSSSAVRFQIDTSASANVSAVSVMIKRGSLIVFEGCDRSGKTTQCQKIKQWFQDNSIKSHFMRFPGNQFTCFSRFAGLMACTLFVFI